ncbi:class I SAM-dependent methyltransferase [Amycolatopsis balhimycina DSM 5908]|uniref:Class I SAM-dependent methyltransferase n=1 Tax=Amycolatopsis balhimycina DSM 5908 TaxID=1081091 RepID=A0A428WG80_AMYBA|nr:class I SAM-dependent methyltransferase [Amycolatopsis balhimycina]RSM42060.1 class I SAM-dependent methyltransferase [Amycolatopsis balhimycina DSM 5908]
MPMNLIHRKLCSSAKWASMVADVLPAWVAKHDLGDDVLEIGPGFGATTKVLLDVVPKLTVLEIDPASTELLRAQFGGRADVHEGSGAEMPFPDGRFSAVVCFTMLHHVPTAELQDAIFAEAARVLRPGGRFCGTDSRLSFRFRLLHIGDTMNVVDAGDLPARLEKAGFEQVKVTARPKEQVDFAAVKPG